MIGGWLLWVSALLVSATLLWFSGPTSAREHSVWLACRSRRLASDSPADRRCQLRRPQLCDARPATSAPSPLCYRPASSSSTKNRQGSDQNRRPQTQTRSQWPTCFLGQCHCSICQLLELWQPNTPDGSNDDPTLVACLIVFPVSKRTNRLSAPC